MPHRTQKKGLHRLLVRQLKRHLGVESLATLSPELQNFMNAVSQAYDETDLDRQLMERSMELSSMDLQKSKEAVEQALQIRRLFIANMSHEIRTPMNGVMGMTNLLLETNLDETQKDYTNTIQSSAQSLMTVINDVLDFSKIESGEFSIAPRVFNFRERLEQIVKLFAPRALIANLAMIIEIDRRIPDEVVTDPERMSQILINLIGNSVKFTLPGGAILLYVEQRSRTKSEIEVAFNIIDSGIGIPRGRFEQIFEPFTQVDPTNRRSFGGTGLGLTISAQLAKLLGGQIEVRSELGVGSVFSFTSKLGIAGLSAPAQQNGSDNEMKVMDYALLPLNILVAEDNLVNQKLIERMLKKQGHTVTIAPNGKAAFATYQQKKFDLVLMDIQMPLLDGVATTHAIRTLELGTNNHVPIIALTAHAMEGDRERYLAEGMDDYIPKPIDRVVLNQTLLRNAPLARRQKL